MTERPAHLGIRHLALHAEALDEMKRFYVELLGFRVEWEPDADNVYLTSGTDNLALHRARGRLVRDRSPLDHLGLLVRSPAEVDAWAGYLEAHGVAIAARPRTHRDGARSWLRGGPRRQSDSDHPPPADQRRVRAQAHRSSPDGSAWCPPTLLEVCTSYGADS